MFLALALVAMLVSTALVALASTGGCATPTITWTGSTSNSWHTASNWLDNQNANRVPGAEDHVCIKDVATTGAITFTTGTTSVASLESAEALTLSGGTLNLTSPTEGSKVNDFTLSGGTLGGAGSLTIPAGGSFKWTGGHMSGSGQSCLTTGTCPKTVIDPAATLTISSTSDKALREGRVLENAGSATFSANYISSGTGAVIENSGTFEIQGDPEIYYNYGGTKTRFENTGTLKKTSGTASSDIGAAVGNNGSVEVSSGTLNLQGGLNNFSSTGGLGKLTGGTYVVKSSSTLKFLGADIDVNAATIVLDGTGSAILDQNNFDAIDNLTDNDGSLTIGSDRDLTTVGALTNDGSVSIGANSVLTTTGDYVQPAGSTTLEETTSKLAASGTARTVRVQGGVMEGVGTVEPAMDVTGGRVAPGLARGILKRLV